MPDDSSYKIGIWTTINEFNELSNEIERDSYTDCIAVGGDGSVNLVARSALKTKTQLGIIPTGSGNGLARTLGISLKPEKAINQILKNVTNVIDAGEVNGTFFFCTSGVGFDAHIGYLFANLKTRGLKTYIKLIFKEYFSYKPESYIVQLNNQKLERKAFFITVANAGQFGNDFYIAPQAKLNDGLFHVVIAKPFSLLNSLGMLFKILNKKANASRFFETFTCSQLSIERVADGSIHYDGEPMQQGKVLNYKIHPQALKVIVNEKNFGS